MCWQDRPETIFQIRKLITKEARCIGQGSTIGKSESELELNVRKICIIYIHTHIAICELF